MRRPSRRSTGRSWAASLLMIDQLLTHDWIVYAAPAVAAVALVGWFAYLPDRYKGPAADFWNYGRRLLLPLLNRLARRRGLGYASYALGEDEFVGTVDASIDEVELALEDAGFERMPLSALKETPDGRVERGSWAYRESPLAERQLHVMLFEAADGVDLYAHDEFNAFHPAHALKHYRGVDLDPDAGERQLREMLDEADLRIISK